MTAAERETLVVAVTEKIVREAMRMFLADDLDAEIDCADIFAECGLCESEIASINDDGLARANATLRDLDRRGLDVLGERAPTMMQ